MYRRLLAAKKIAQRHRLKVIEEKLKLQEARRQNAQVDEAAVDGVIKNIAQRNKMTPEQFGSHLGSQGVAISSMRQRFKATLSWNEVIRRKFGRQVEISQRDGRVYLRNLSKTNPTLVDGVPLTEGHPLRSSSLVGNRDFIVRLVYEDARPINT